MSCRHRLRVVESRAREMPSKAVVEEKRMVRCTTLVVTLGLLLGSCCPDGEGGLSLGVTAILSADPNPIGLPVTSVGATSTRPLMTDTPMVTPMTETRSRRTIVSSSTRASRSSRCVKCSRCCRPQSSASCPRVVDQRAAGVTS